MDTDWDIIEGRNSDGEESEELRLPLLAHLEELRTRLIRIIAILVVGWIIGYAVQTPIYSALLLYAKSQIPKGEDYREVFRNLMDPFMLKMKFGFYLGLILTFPLIVWQAWGFIKPGLKKNEVEPFKVIVPLSSGLFILGAAVCWMVIPLALQWFASYLSDFPGTSLYQEPGTLVFFIMKMMLAFGFGFQLPVVVWFLVRVGLLTPQALMANWRHATVVIFIVSMLITPSNDVPSMLMMAIPLTLLFFLSLIAVRWSIKRSGEEPEPWN